VLVKIRNSLCVFKISPCSSRKEFGKMALNARSRLRFDRPLIEHVQLLNIESEKIVSGGRRFLCPIKGCDFECRRYNDYVIHFESKHCVIECNKPE